jgi:L-asparagine transporter-like permease
MKSTLSPYKLINVLSLDVAGGAVSCAAFFADVFDVSILPQGLIALGLAVWIIYTLDHLLDARRLQQRASTIRHQFHYTHFKTLSVVVVIVFCVELILIFFLREQIFRRGILLSLMVIVYISISHWLKYAKEIAGALLYSCGVLLPALSLKDQLFGFRTLTVVAPFVLIVLTNLILFSWMDYEQDKRDGQPSIITLLGKKMGSFVLLFLFFCIAIVLLFSFRSLPRDVFFIYSFMTSVLLYIFLKPHLFNSNDRFRHVGDGIFLLPLIHWLV